MKTLIWDLDDKKSYFKLLSATIPHAYTWGSDERDKRENTRKAVAPHLPKQIPPARWWAFRLYAKKTGNRWDVENIPKLVVDAFSREQIDKDGSTYPQLGLYQNDTLEYVQMVLVAGEQIYSGNSTIIEIFGAH